MITVVTMSIDQSGYLLAYDYDNRKNDSNKSLPNDKSLQITNKNILQMNDLNLGSRL
jgi:hypothetical protein